MSDPHTSIRAERRTMADGTVQQRCPGTSWQCLKWFDVVEVGRPAKWCSGACRVAAHRAEAERKRREAERIAREQHLARVTAEHRARYVRFIEQHTPANGRMSRQKCTELYQALLAADMIPQPFQQERMF